MMRALLVGERFNMSHRRTSFKFPDPRWFEYMRRLGALHNDLRLLHAGVRWDASMNLTERDVQGVPWNAPMARAVAVLVKETYVHQWNVDLVWMAGQRVGDAFAPTGMGHLDFLDAHVDRDGVTYVQLPHPSGLNRWWNDVANVAALEILCQGLGQVHTEQEARVPHG